MPGVGGAKMLSVLRTVSPMATATITTASATARLCGSGAPGSDRGSSTSSPALLISSATKGSSGVPLPSRKIAASSAVLARTSARS